MYILTIIIPHYNSTASLNRLLRTIPDSGEIQTIVIDDHSDEYHKKELQRIGLHYNMELLENASDKKGAGACRNIGLEHAKGEWIVFADADDYFIEGFYGILQRYFQSGADVIFFKPTSVESDSGVVSSRHLPLVKLIDDVLDGSRPREAELSLRYKFVVPWSKLYKTAFLKDNQIFFDEVISANDIMFSTKAGYHMNKFELSEDVIYCVTMNKGSLTMTINNDVFDTRLNVFINQYQFTKEHLSRADFKKLRLTGRPLLIKSSDLGLKKVITVFLTLKRHKVRLIEPRLLNPIWFIKKALFVFRKQRREQKYLNKG
ncbi:glycosyltransferase family 2 protein [Virgibacillus doumboii]|uniref:glycosyltransferase family 2 protein n=1 Tax=Virgibacillus doumboii TaxID=2697503 RepID=UPI0013E0B2F2|nr:glycosyltransferase family A protein [Virgibacillus doumboii]